MNKVYQFLHLYKSELVNFRFGKPFLPASTKISCVDEAVQFISSFLSYISIVKYERHVNLAGLRSTVSNVSGYRCVTDCISRGCKFDPGQVPYFRGD